MTSTFASSEITEPAWFHGVWVIQPSEDATPGSDAVPEFDLLASSGDVSVRWLVQSLTVTTGELDDRTDTPLISVHYRLELPPPAEDAQEEKGAAAAPLPSAGAVREVALGQAKGVWGIQGSADLSAGPSFLFLNLEVPGGIGFRAACLISRDEDAVAGDTVTLRVLRRKEAASPASAAAEGASSAATASVGAGLGAYAATGVEALFRRVPASSHSDP